VLGLASVYTIHIQVISTAGLTNETVADISQLAAMYQSKAGQWTTSKSIFSKSFIQYLTFPSISNFGTKIDI